MSQTNNNPASEVNTAYRYRVTVYTATGAMERRETIQCETGTEAFDKAATIYNDTEHAATYEVTTVFSVASYHDESEIYTVAQGQERVCEMWKPVGQSQFIFTYKPGDNERICFYSTNSDRVDNALDVIHNHYNRHGRLPNTQTYRPVG